MSFKPLPDQEYFLFPKHSKNHLVLSTPNYNMGAGIELQAFDFNNALQKFRFDKGARAYWVLLPNFKDRYARVKDATKESHTDQHKAPIVLDIWALDQPYTLFRFVPAGGGFYRIMALHSRMYWDVYNAKDEEKAGVVQHILSQTDNQLFMPVPVPAQPLKDNPASLNETNEMVRTAVMGLISQVPEVGGGLKFVTGLFWSEKDKLGDLWKQMKSYVDARVRALITEKMLDDMARDLIGIMDVLQEISDSKEVHKGARLTGVLDSLTKAAPLYLNRPVEVLPYLMGFGTIVITLRRIVVTNYEQLFGTAPSAELQAQNEKFLTDAIQKYSDDMAKSRTALLKWRKEQIPDYKHNSTGRELSFVDNYDGWKQRWSYTDNAGYENGKFQIERAVSQRRAQVNQQFETEIDDFLKPAFLWPYFEPGKTLPAPKKRHKKVGKFGSGYTNTPFRSPDGKKITKINAYSKSEGALTGIEVFYDGVSYGVCGAKDSVTEVLELNSDEFITSIFGFAQNSVEGLWFTTHAGKMAGGGEGNVDGRSDHYFSPDLADNLNAHLVGISGSYSKNKLEAVEFDWEYME